MGVSEGKCSTMNTPPPPTHTQALYKSVYATEAHAHTHAF